MTLTGFRGRPMGNPMSRQKPSPLVRKLPLILGAIVFIILLAVAGLFVA